MHEHWREVLSSQHHLASSKPWSSWFYCHFSLWVELSVMASHYSYQALIRSLSKILPYLKYLSPPVDRSQPASQATHSFVLPGTAGMDRSINPSLYLAISVAIPSLTSRLSSRIGRCQQLLFSWRARSMPGEQHPCVQHKTRSLPLTVYHTSLKKMWKGSRDGVPKSIQTRVVDTDSN